MKTPTKNYLGSLPQNSSMPMNLFPTSTPPIRKNLALFPSYNLPSSTSSIFFQDTLMVSPPAIVHRCLAVAQALQTRHPSLRKPLAKKNNNKSFFTYSRTQSIFLDQQPRHGPWSSVSNSFRFSSLCWCCQNSSSDSSSRHPCSLSSCSTSKAASTRYCFSSSSCCFLSASCLSSSSTAQSNASSFSRSSLSLASHTLLISSACLCISAGDGWFEGAIAVVVCYREGGK